MDIYKGDNFTETGKFDVPIFQKHKINMCIFQQKMLMLHVPSKILYNTVKSNNFKSGVDFLPDKEIGVTKKFLWKDSSDVLNSGHNESTWDFIGQT